jgi:hypothetical protein
LFSDREQESNNSVIHHLWFSEVDIQGKTLLEKEIGLDSGYSQVIQASDGGYAILVTGGLVKLDSEGNIIWSQIYEGEYSLVSLDSVCQTKEGGFVIGGTISGYTGDSEVIGNTRTTYEYPEQSCLVKVDSAGNVEWNQTFSIEVMPTHLVSVVQTSDGGYAIVGTSDGQYTYSIAQIFFAKTDNLGNVLWDKLIGVENFGEYPTSMFQTSDGGYIIAGVLEKNSSTSAPGLVKLDSSGNIQWQQLYGGDLTAVMACVIQTKDGGYVFAGDKQASGTSENVYGYNFWLVNVDSAGNTQWEHLFPLSNYDFTNQVIQTNDYGYLITGYTSPQSNSLLVPCLIKTDENGNTSELSLQDASNPSPSIPEYPLNMPILAALAITGIAIIISKTRTKRK